jgi:hypothetical protein
MASDMIASARQQTTDGKEVVRIVEEQIKALERRARLELTQTRINTRNALDRGEISQGAANIANTGAVDSYNDTILSSRTLRDILATLQTNAREEARRDNTNTTAVIQQGDQQQADNQDQSSDEIQALRDSLAGRTRQSSEDSSSEGDEDDSNESSGSRNRQRASNVVRTTYAAAQQTALSRNEFFALSALTSFIPIVGGGISNLLNKALGQAEAFEGARSSLNSLNSRGVNATGTEASQYGVSSSTFMSNYAMNAARAQGSTKNLEGQAIDVLLAEKQLGISGGTSTGVLRTMRNDKDAKDLGITIGKYISSVAYGDAGVRGGDFTKLEEYVQIANSLAQRQTAVLDSVDVALNGRIMGSFAKLGGTFQDPQVLGSIIQAIDGSLSRPSSPYAQAMQFSVLAKQNPNMSRFELIEQQQKGIAAPGLMQGMMSMLSSASGGNQNLLKEQVLAMFPQLSAAQVTRMVKGYSEGNLDLSFTQAGKDSSVLGKIERGGLVGNLQRNTAEIDNIFAVQGDKMVQQLQGILDSVGGFAGAIDSLLGLGVDLLSSVNSAIQFFGGKTSAKTNKLITPK